LNVLDYLNKKKKISKESFLKKEYTITKLDKIAVLKMDKPKRNLKKSYEEIDNKKPGEHDKFIENIDLHTLDNPHTAKKQKENLRAKTNLHRIGNFAFTKFNKSQRRIDESKEKNNPNQVSDKPKIESEEE